ncbi:MAG: phytanoyl-CoA dioxygenase family protein, partial [Proteobacteria bacterium]|nr:phytanoyl-CoA dioxygenase family protein [Pseudomonadota bacterium]
MTGLLQQGHAVIDGLDSFAPHEDFDSLLAGEDGGSRRIPASHDLIELLLRQPKIARLVSGLLGPDARPVRAIAFDKTAGRNWLVPWHQDRTIAVDQRDEAADVRCWTVKNGVDHCEPPVGLLERMVTLRWHLDAVGPEDGCIRVLPGSHRMGRLV